MLWALGWQLLIRSTLLLGAAALLRYMCRRRDPALRHRLILFAFALLAVLPVMFAVLPAVQFPMWPEGQERGGVTVQQTSFIAGPGERARSVNWPLLIWLGGAAVALFPMMAGAFAARRLVWRADPLTGDYTWDALLASVGAAHRPELFSSSELLAPLTCGVFTPRIVLPESAQGWPVERRRAVLLHELAHIRRRDVAAQLFVHFIAALWWFQPLAWMLRTALRTESELACDAEALASGFRPSQYAAELLAVAKGMRAEVMLTSVGISMARRAGLEARVRAVLHPSSMLILPVRVRGALVCLTAVAIAASTVTAQSKSTDPGGLLMKRSLLAGLLTTAGLSAATVSGSLFDPSGAAIPDAKLVLYNPDTGAKQEASSGSDGRFNMPDVPAGQYILRVAKPGFSSIFREFDLKGDAKIDRGLTMDVGHMQQEVSVAEKGKAFEPSQAETPNRVRVGGQVAEANLVRKVQPVYPAAAKSAGLQGTVELEAVISNEGVPLEIRVISSPGDDLTQSALEAVRQWRYRPVLLNGQPVEVMTDVIVNYTLSR